MPRINIPPLPPGWRAEEEPTYPEPIKGSGTPITPPEADPFTGQPVATPLSANYKDQIEQMVSKLANRTGKFATGGGEPAMAGSVMGQTRDRLSNVIAGYLKMFAPDPTDIPMPGMIVPKLRGWGRELPGAFTRTEMQAQKDLSDNPKLEKLLRSLQNDKRVGAQYTLDLKPQTPGRRGQTVLDYNPKTGARARGSSIEIELDPHNQIFSTPIHEATHAFSYRRRPYKGGGTDPKVNEYFESMPLHYQKQYLKTARGDRAHAALAAQADAAAHRLQLAPTPFGNYH